MKKYIIREVEPDCASFESYFDDDGISAAGGDFCYTLFIINRDGWRNYCGINADEWKRVQADAKQLIEDFYELRGEGWYAPSYSNYKEAMIANGISYNPTKCHALKEWALDADEDNAEDMAAFLSITTGKKWSVCGVRGYCQGDYCQVVFCEEMYKHGVQNYGEVYLGCAKEFGVIELDEDGNECDSCYGYIVADCEARNDEDYKRIVSEWAGISANEAQLEMIDGCSMVRSYSYRIA